MSKMEGNLPESSVLPTNGVTMHLPQSRMFVIWWPNHTRSGTP